MPSIYNLTKELEVEALGELTSITYLTSQSIVKIGTCTCISVNLPALLKC